ncbi:type II secretion system protein [Sedimentisphaera salicampi]|uniref:Tfp pilus assembly protein FimT n=1 Tax=Sedimentisphaera salicampi TaxID=1941349 RepID=A0A1W6LJG5_9BACT|nr:type II secretion system protein [Sedimentisphaera salicampi]ARN55921.1 Tfp pilus assembly protein FimT [Sedimentisphaera salicampi]
MNTSANGKDSGSTMIRSKSCGFSLIELLAVISITAILISFLIPALAKAREHAQCAVCLSNQRNTGIALRLYIDNHNGVLPSAEPYPGKYGSLKQHWFMNPEFLSYLDIELRRDDDGDLLGPPQSRSVLTCPAHRKPARTRHSPPEYPEKNKGYALSFAANAVLGVSGRGSMPTEYRKEGEFRRPSEAMMFTDANGTLHVPGVVLFEGCPRDNFAFRHNSKANILFLDQHTEKMGKEEIPFFNRFSEKRFGKFWYAKRN